MNKSDLKPARVFEQFAKINQIPRPSKREEKMIEYLTNWGKSHQLETVVDETGNVIIRKSATPGMENRKTLILQSHMDMVCEKLVDLDFDFDRDAIQPMSTVSGCVQKAPHWELTMASDVPSNWPSSTPTMWNTVPWSVYSPAMRKPD